jgi:hypothetical protein
MHRRKQSHIEEWAALLDADVPDDLSGEDRRHTDGRFVE